MTAHREPYRQYVPSIELSLECNTEDAPKDGWYYVIKSKEIIGRFKNYRLALEEYKSIRDDLVERIVVDTPSDLKNAFMDQSLANDKLGWAISHGFRRRGGKGR